MAYHLHSLFPIYHPYNQQQSQTLWEMVLQWLIIVHQQNYLVCLASLVVHVLLSRKIYFFVLCLDPESQPTMKDLYLIKWQDDHGKERRINIIESGSNKWTEIGHLFEIDGSVLKGFEDKWRDNSERFASILQRWLHKGGTSSYQCTWNGLIEALRDVKHGNLADDLKNALMSNSMKC